MIAGVPDPQTAARQFVWLASVEAQVRSLRGIEPLSSREIGSIARDTAALIVGAHQPKLAAGAALRPVIRSRVVDGS